LTNLHFSLHFNPFNLDQPTDPSLSFSLPNVPLPESKPETPSTNMSSSSPVASSELMKKESSLPTSSHFEPDNNAIYNTNNTNNMNTSNNKSTETPKTKSNQDVQKNASDGLMKQDGTMKRAQTGSGPVGEHSGGSAFVTLNHQHIPKEPKLPFHKVLFPIPELQPKKTPNYIRTTKYTILTFIPLNLYFQVSFLFIIQNYSKKVIKNMSSLVEFIMSTFYWELYQPSEERLVFLLGL
jgi:hypothetical protein